MENEKLKTCHDCGAEPGTPHERGCDVERCSVCGAQRLLCAMLSKCPAHDPVFSRWTGIWPGYAEAKELDMDLNTFYVKRHHEIFFIKPIEVEPKCLECEELKEEIQAMHEDAAGASI